MTTLLDVIWELMVSLGFHRENDVKDRPGKKIRIWNTKLLSLNTKIVFNFRNCALKDTRESDLFLTQLTTTTMMKIICWSTTKKGLFVYFIYLWQVPHKVGLFICHCGNGGRRGPTTQEECPWGQRWERRWRTQSRLVDETKEIYMIKRCHKAHGQWWPKKTYYWVWDKKMPNRHTIYGDRRILKRRPSGTQKTNRKDPKKDTVNGDRRRTIIWEWRWRLFVYLFTPLWWQCMVPSDVIDLFRYDGNGA